MNSPGRGDQADYGNFFSSPFPDIQKNTDTTKQKVLVVTEEPTTPIEQFPADHKQGRTDSHEMNELSSSNSEVRSSLNDISPDDELRAQPLFSGKHDKMLLESVKLHGKNWKKVKKDMNQTEYTPEVLKKRFDQIRSNEFKPGRKFTHQEDLMLARCHSIYGTKWIEMVKHFEFRDASMLKNRFYSFVKSKLDSLTHENDVSEGDKEKKEEKKATVTERYEPTNWREIIDYSDHIPNTQKPKQASKEQDQNKEKNPIDNQSLLKYVQQLESKISNLENQIQGNKNSK